MPLPGLPPAFRWTSEPWRTAPVCDPLAEVAAHLFTTRALTLRVGPGEGAADRDSWNRLAGSMAVDPSRLLRLRQVHGRDVLTLRRGTVMPPVRPAPEADALVADAPDAALVIRGADCVPILMADRRTGAVGAAHAGWRGTALATGVAAVDAMRVAFGTRPADLVVALGPSIGPCCYPVGESVREAFVAAGHVPTVTDRWFARGADLRLDLWLANVAQLEAAGVPAAQIHVSRICTACHADLCFSYRREGAGTGRLAGAIRASRASTYFLT
jgi:YfiH family protein